MKRKTELTIGSILLAPLLAMLIAAGALAARENPGEAIAVVVIVAGLVGLVMITPSRDEDEA